MTKLTDLDGTPRGLDALRWHKATPRVPVLEAPNGPPRDDYKTGDGDTPTQS